MRIIPQLQPETLKNGQKLIRINLRDGQGRQKRYSLGLHIPEEAWDAKMRRVRSDKHPNAAIYNQKIARYVMLFEQQVGNHPDWTIDQHIEAVDRPVVVPGSIGFVEAVRDMMERYPSESWHTRQQRHFELRRFDLIHPGVRLSDLNKDHMYACQQLWRRQGVSQNTIATRFKRLRAMYRAVCKRHGVEPSNILEDVNRGEAYTKLKVQFTPEEIQKLIEALPSLKLMSERRALAIWLFSLFCGGVRFGDACVLTDDELQGRRLVYMMSKTKARQKWRSVELSDEALALIDMCREGRMLFGVRGDQIPTTRQIAAACAWTNKKLKHIGKRLGLTKPLRTHNARHSFANLALLRGLDDRTIQSIMCLSDQAYKHYRGTLRQDVLDDALKSVVGSLLPHQGGSTAP